MGQQQQQMASQPSHFDLAASSHDDFLEQMLFALPSSSWPDLTMSETLGDGNTEKVSIIRSGYSSLIFEIKRVPIPEPVPPPNK
ncbi:hypothetical protein RJ640_025992 [Escallonia rubra]|uniref:Uncharacterized protein n=1 Tax=Escallonia rubra TaxID=112253 RepID=A0AA88USQ1_9ASTE|nr:hypothetical protein RJ640_025992 [Escallonia rubra]